MIKAGQGLIVVGFMIGAASSVIEPDKMYWTWFVIGMVFGVIGVGMVRLGLHREGRHEDLVADNLEAIRTSLAELSEKSAVLDSEKEAMDVYKVHETIDDRFPDVLDKFVKARETIMHRYGMEAYAEVMNHFAAGERSLNRSWSASVDGYFDEVKTSLGKAARHFSNANKEFMNIDKP
jgi:hypothetical protein